MTRTSTPWRMALTTHPSWPVFALVASAWLVMAYDAVAAGRLTCCSPCPTVVADLGSWIAMTIAMMVPTVVVAMNDLAARSYRSRRPRAVAFYLVGYLGPWTVVGACVAGARQIACDVRWVPPAACVCALAWLAHPQRERWHRACHRRLVLYPIGGRADVDALRQGGVHSLPCIAMCWPLMIACAATNHDLLFMAGGAFLASFEKGMFRLRIRPLAIGIALLFAWTLVRL